MLLKNPLKLTFSFVFYGSKKGVLKNNSGRGKFLPRCTKTNRVIAEISGSVRAIQVSK